MFFLSGWTFALYMALPVIRIFFGDQPLAGATADQFPRPLCALLLPEPRRRGGGWRRRRHLQRVALLIANFSVQILATLFVLTRRRGRFVVTAKRGRRRPPTVHGAADTPGHRRAPERHWLRARPERHRVDAEQRGLCVPPPSPCCWPDHGRPSSVAAAPCSTCRRATLSRPFPSASWWHDQKFHRLRGIRRGRSRAQAQRPPQLPRRRGVIRRLVLTTLVMLLIVGAIATLAIEGSRRNESTHKCGDALPPHSRRPLGPMRVPRSLLERYEASKWACRAQGPRWGHRE